MKTTIFCFLLFFTAIAGAQVVAIPDANFKAKLLSANTSNNIARNSSGTSIVIDVNGDGNIQATEALLVYKLKVENAMIASLEGVQYFYNLEELECNQNQLTTLNLSGLDNLEAVECYGNQLTELDFSENPLLTALICSNNNLASINLKNGIFQSSLTTGVNEWGSNPNLAFICADEDEESIINTILAASALTGVTVNTFCSFTPGGDYNTITGTVLFDGDNDGCDTADAPQSFIKVFSTDGVQSCTTFTSTAGTYDFYPYTGNFTITPQFENNYFTVSPASALATFNFVDNSVQTHNFCLTPTTAYSDVEVVMEPIVQAVAGNMASYKMVYKNKGNQVVSGAVSCTWNTSLFNNVTTVPVANYVGTSLYSWDYTNLKPFENREIIIYLNVNGPTNNPPVYNGDVLNFTAMVSSNYADGLPADNSFTYHQTVVATANPNSITCIEGDTQPGTAMGNYLHYVINFKNTGTTTTQNVVITQEIDPAHFNIDSIELLNSSLPVTTTVTGSTAKFAFKNANLATGGGGNILFKVKTKPNMQQGASVSATAKIFYDYKPPVETNDANTTFGELSTGNFEFDASVKVYPNPSNNGVTIDANSAINSVELYDIQGRLLETNIVNSSTTVLSISNRANGIYFIKITTLKGVKVEKVIKQ